MGSARWPRTATPPLSAEASGPALTDGDGRDLRVLLGGEVLHVPAGVVTGHGAHQDRGVWLHLRPGSRREVRAWPRRQRGCRGGEPGRPQRTSVSTMWVRSSGCSMMDMKDSPRLVDTNTWAMASRRSGRKAWIRSRRWMACPMGAETRQGWGSETRPRLGRSLLRTRSVQDSAQSTPQITMSLPSSLPARCHKSLQSQL